MSYLDWPRINLGGTFFTDPSTVNNDPSHYNEDVVRPSPWQDPKGLHRFKFVDVKVQGALDERGNFVGDDPIIGITANSADQPSAAKIADLDVYQQGVPTIFGFQLQLSLSSQVNIVGAMDPCCCNGLWWNRVLPTRGWQSWDSYGNAGFGGDTYACAAYQSVLRVDPASWPVTSGSSVLDMLRSATTTDGNGNLLVSIRMVLDSYNNVPWHDDFNLGRAVATLGPVFAGELEHIPGGRWLDPYPSEPQPAPAPPVPPWFWPSFYSAPFKFIQQTPGIMRLVIDMADAITMQQVGGPPVPLGELTVYLGDGSTGALGTFQATQDLYQNLGGIVEFEITEAQWQAQQAPLMVVTNRDDLGGIAQPSGLGTMLWQENASGTVIDANDQVFRLPGYAGTTATATVNITQWGYPLAGSQPSVLVQPVYQGVQGASVPPPAKFPGDSPGPAVETALTASISTVDQNGNCTVTLTVNNDPGSRTTQLDGQLYFVLPYFGDVPNLYNAPPRQESLISVVVFAQFPYTIPPSWETVQAIMTPYVKLYPGMTDQIDLTQQQAFFTFACNPPWQAYDGPNMVPYTLPNGTQISAGAIPYYMTRGFTDTRYMPVTRDMSPDKLLCVLYYIASLQAVVQPTPPPPSSGGRP